MSMHKVPFRVDSDNFGGLRRVIGFASYEANIRVYIIEDEDGVFRGSFVGSNRGFQQISNFKVFKDYETAVLVTCQMLGQMAHAHKISFPKLLMEFFDEEFYGRTFEQTLEWFKTCGFFDVREYRKIEVE